MLPVASRNLFCTPPTTTPAPAEPARLDDRGETKPREECGVFGVWAPGEEVAKLTYFGLFALQHRGQEAAGIAVGDGERIIVYKDMGLVSQIFDEDLLGAFEGDVAIGHTRYSTAGGTDWNNVQPMFRTTPNGVDIALDHNGNLVNFQQLRDEALELGVLDADSASDTNVLTSLLAHNVNDDTSVFAAAAELLPRVHGAFCLTFTDGKTLYAARDPFGVRPLALGRLDRGWVVASETCALDIVGASFVREIEPGEMVAIDAAGVRSERFAPTNHKGCVFEYVYLARPDSVIRGRTVNAARVEIGRRLAREFPTDGDLVMPVPESGTPAAVGYARESGIPFDQGLVKNSYVGRTFIQPSQTLRQLGIRLKLNPLREVIAGKRLIVVDDSIVRGNTQRALIRMLREAGAAEVHVRIASPPVKWPCFYGIDFASPGELIANSGDSADDADIANHICTAIGADSLAFVSVEQMIEATEQRPEQLCAACFDGNYPLGLPAGNSNAELVAQLQATPADR
ncbi:amidophosphoribosyltransferase [Corynebacterium uberis]|uniref:amidophosphoribosyltransferase n=1 Tax=Corynebacterium uberis TaxID=2883169 RepID=UPI003D1616D4